MSSSDGSDTSSDDPLPTAYDAVAGRLDERGFLSPPDPSKKQDETSDGLEPMPPDEALAHFCDAPPRYQESDAHEADRHLDENNELTQLPDSDLLKAIHAYASDFHARLAEEEGADDYVSLEESALIALGIMIEEAAGQMLDGVGRESSNEGTDEAEDSSDEESDEESPSDEEMRDRSESDGSDVTMEEAE